MPPTSKRQKLAKNARAHIHDSGSSSNTENLPLTPSNSPPIRGRPPKNTKDRKKPVDEELAERNDHITELKVLISDADTDILRLETSLATLQEAHDALLGKNKTMNTTLSLKRKAETSYSEERTRARKRIRRLERDRDTKAQTNAAAAAPNARLHAYENDTHTTALTNALCRKQDLLNATQKQLYASEKREKRAQLSYKTMKRAYDELRVWKPTESGEFTNVSRELVRNLSYTGCAAGKVAFAISSCAKAFGIEIRGRLMSARTVGRVIDEGGKYGELQIAREIMEAEVFCESSDGRTHYGLTIEGRHVTLRVPSYAPDADNSDKSTWTTQTRFVEVVHALDHTAQRQFNGTVEMATQIADTYSRSPLAARERRTMDKNHYWRKKLAESKDHAANGKKAFRISAEHKKDIIIHDLGRVAMDEADISTSHILTTILSITDEDLAAEGKLTAAQLSSLSTEARSLLVEDVLERKIGEDRFDALTPAEQSNKCTHFFGGCCCHKDLNVVEYGYKSVQRIYSELDNVQVPPPVLLANKANAATITEGSKDSAAVQNAIDSSTSGGIKLQLIGSLLRHKDGERGYQDKATIFIRRRKFELYSLDEPSKFPDVSNTRYGCYTYAAAEIVCFHGIIQELVTEVINAKTKSGPENHVEKNVLKGLNCAVTMTELVALALYGVSVSWPYMATVRSTKDRPVNLLSLTDLHRKLPLFCAHIAANPHTLLDPTTLQDQLTIDGQPFLDEFLLVSIRQLQPYLRNPFLMISRMFAGCETGWIIFTPEFHIGRTIARLTPEQLATLHVPVTNDCSKGILGTFKGHTKYRPNSTPHSFTNQTRTQRNNTEAFIKKCCDRKDKKYVMREVRKDGMGQKRAKFQREWAKLQREKAEKALKRREAAALKKKSRASRLAAT
ncbi:hypothetical protein B0H16DRAFT_1733359 [Mycena metata]|uniref:Uncharacterized protein n=1 Tax=Mycena metata TaxID=1033252 RepID=A0AAD7MTE3_9AGAR|nr:hypothetical protein B0H16DRAFT_1733359 [Mycena metata]